jgi:hypothetical protein
MSTENQKEKVLVVELMKTLINAFNDPQTAKDLVYDSVIDVDAICKVFDITVHDEVILANALDNLTSLGFFSFIEEYGEYYRQKKKVNIHNIRPQTVTYDYMLTLPRPVDFEDDFEDEYYNVYKY